jgi:hypothetical protein
MIPVDVELAIVAAGRGLFLRSLRLAADSHETVARHKQGERENSNQGKRFIVRMPHSIRNVDMVLLEITRHAGIIETAMLSGQAIIDGPLFTQIAVGNGDYKTSGNDCQKQKSGPDLPFDSYATSSRFGC